ncbi:universal stress protein [bacterium]|nr:universal stress protein [bacterium]
MPYSKILVPLDGSPLAELAAQHAARLARTCKAHLIFIRVAQPEQTQEAALYLHKINQQAHYELLDTEAMVRYGSAAERIVDTANEMGVDLIVLSSHGRTGLSRQVFGSVAESVMRSANCPVTVVKSFRGNASQPADGQ